MEPLPPVPEAIGHYNLVRVLGRGASAGVYLARDVIANRDVAVKVFWHPEGKVELFEGRHRAVFLNEVALVGRLEHPHIVSLLDAAVDREFSYVVMEYVEGSTLERFAAADSLLPVAKVIELAYKASRALAYAHRQGVIHRDIKPANMLVTEALDLKLSDFGIALLENVTHTSLDLVGSPAYSSPEQIEGRTLEQQTDMWSLGVVMFQLLTGRLPYSATSQESLAWQIVNMPPAALGELRPGLPQAVLDIVTRAMNKNPQLRYSSWENFAADLASLVHLSEQPHDEAVTDARKFEALRGLSFFRGFRDVELWEVLRASSWRRVAAGRTILREGERGESFFVLVDGEVEVSRSGVGLATLVAGGCFGEMLYFEEPESLRTTTVRASSAVVAIEIRSAALAGASNGCQVKFNRSFMRILLSRLDALNRRLAGD